MAAELADLEARKRAKYRQIRDAEADRAAGKLTEDDFQRLDRELRAEAIQILKRIDRLRGPGSPDLHCRDMATVLSVIEVIISVILIFVLLHSGKDAGLSGAFGIGGGGSFPVAVRWSSFDPVDHLLRGPLDAERDRHPRF